MDFNPLAPRGARPFRISSWSVLTTFQSTRPSRGETGQTALAAVDTAFQSTRPSRGETIVCPTKSDILKISSHSPLAGRDNGGGWMLAGGRHFNPLAPRGARPGGLPHDACGRGDFNPLAPRGARLQKVTKYFLQKPFFLHNSYSCGFENWPIKKKNELYLGGGEQACIRCEPTRNLVCAGGSQSKDQRLIRRKDG